MSPARFGGALGATRAALVLVISSFSVTAQAYPWMNRHGYTNCATCHADPSGAGLLTRYGRAQSELRLGTRYTKGESDEPSRYSDALFGIAQLPEWLLVGGWVRSAYLWNSSEGSLVPAECPPPSDDRWVSCDASRDGGCVDTCHAIKRGVPSVPAGSCR